MYDEHIKSLRFTLTSPVTATSGNVVLAYNPIPVSGRIVGIEVGSPAFGANTGSLYVIASGATWNQTRLVTQVNGIAQARTYYSIFEYAQVKGASVSGTTGPVLFNPVVDGDQIGIATSGTYGGTNVLAIVYYV